MFKRSLCCLLAFVIVGGTLTGCGKKPPAGPQTAIAADEARGIQFSKDKKTLMKYNPELPDSHYTIPEGVTTIGELAFYNCKNLTDVTIPEGVTTIGESAFAGCEKLESVNIPSSVKLIGCRAFAGCPCAGTLTIPPQTTLALDTKRIAEDENWGIEYSADKKTLKRYNPKLELVNYTLPEGVTAIEKEAFACAGNLKKVTLPFGVTTIGNEAFAGCRKLESVTIPASVTSIGNNAFAGS